MSITRASGVAATPIVFTALSFSTGVTTHCGFVFCSPLVGQESPSARGFLITHNDAPQSVGLLWTSDQSVAETSTWQHSQQTNIHAPSGIRTHDCSRRTAVDLRLRPCGYWDRHSQPLLPPIHYRLLLLLLSSLFTCLFFLVLLLNQRWSPPLRVQVSHCSTFRIMCDIPSIAVFCSESIECFPVISSKFLLKLLVTIPVASAITGIIVHFRFHIRCISIPKLLYFNLFSPSFCTTFLSAGIATSISVHVFSFLFLIIISGLFAVTSLAVYCLIPQHRDISLFIHWLGHLCVPFVCCFNA